MQFSLVATLVVRLEFATDYPSEWRSRRSVTLQHDPFANVQAMRYRQQRDSVVLHDDITVQRCSCTAKCVYGDWLSARQGAESRGKTTR